VPHLPVYGYLAMGEIDEEDAKVVIYFDEYTRDYAFYSQVNGCRGRASSRGQAAGVEVKDRFRNQLADNEGIEFDHWDAVSIGALPVATGATRASSRRTTSFPGRCPAAWTRSSSSACMGRWCPAK